MTRTKLGLALGAGGAKGFAHVGVLGVLKRAGYVVDFLAGSSIGALIGSLLGLGLNVDEIEVQLKRIWAPEHVDLLADLSPEGISVGLERILHTIRDIVGDRMMSDLCLPLRILTADLQEGEAVPLDMASLRSDPSGTFHSGTYTSVQAWFSTSCRRGVFNAGSYILCA